MRPIISKTYNEAWDVFNRADDPYTVERHADGLFFEIPNADQAVYAIYKNIAKAMYKLIQQSKS